MENNFCGKCFVESQGHALSECDCPKEEVKKVENIEKPPMHSFIMGLLEDSDDAAMAQENTIDSSVFKVVVQSVSLHPMVPNKVTSACMCSGSGFLVDVRQFPNFVDVEEVNDDAVLEPYFYIVTNAHVVDSQVQVYVLNALHPTKHIQCSVELVCFDLDLAFLKMRALPSSLSQQKARQIFKPFELCTNMRRFVSLATSEKKETEKKVQIFDACDEKKCEFTRMRRVFAVGYPLGVDRVQMTQGIVSGFERVSEEPVIQMTAPINHGNSGGALIDTKMRVIGITSAGIPSAENVGFAIPITYAFNLLKPLLSDEKVCEIPALGLHTVPLEQLSSIVPNFDPDQMQLQVFSAEKKEISLDVLATKQRETGLLITGFEPVCLLKEFVTGKEPRVYDVITQINEFRIDNDGLTRDSTYPRKMSFADIFRTLPLHEPFTVKFVRGSEKYENTYLFQKTKKQYAVQLLRHENLQNFRVMPLRKDDSLVLAPLTLNFIHACGSRAPWLYHYALPQNSLHARLVVLKDATNMLQMGEIVKKIDGKELFVDDGLASSYKLGDDVVALLSRDLTEKIGKTIEVETESGAHTFAFLKPQMFCMLGMRLL